MPRHGLLVVLLLLVAACRSASPAPPPAPVCPVFADTNAENRVIRFLEDRVKRDPDDFIAYNKLGGLYLRRLRETGNVAYLDLAAKTAAASLAAMPEEQNADGISLQAQVDFATHDFAGARDRAARLVAADPRKLAPKLLLADALLELGDYDRAKAMLHPLERGADAGVLVRLGRIDLLEGRSDLAERLLVQALKLVEGVLPAERETVAWHHWQLAEIAFAAGDYAKAEGRYREALAVFPGYFRAQAGLAKCRAARNDIPGAITAFEEVVKTQPDPTFVAALGDLYWIAGRDREARVQDALVERLAILSGKTLYNRQLALYYANHDLKPTEAHALAEREYAARRDVYGADALAWTALKAGKIQAAQAAIRDALRLGTRDASLWYHAGAIAAAAGDTAAARDWLTRALGLNPKFDPLQAPRARKLLDSLPTSP